MIFPQASRDRETFVLPLAPKDFHVTRTYSRSRNYVSAVLAREASTAEVRRIRLELATGYWVETANARMPFKVAGPEDSSRRTGS